MIKPNMIAVTRLTGDKTIHCVVKPYLHMIKLDMMNLLTGVRYSNRLHIGLKLVRM